MERGVRAGSELCLTSSTLSVELRSNGIGTKPYGLRHGFETNKALLIMPQAVMYRKAIATCLNFGRLCVFRCMAVEFFVVHLKIRRLATGLTPPAVATQNLPAQTFVRPGIQSNGFGFWANHSQDAF
jgi:hypothetical protein